MDSGKGRGGSKGRMIKQICLVKVKREKEEKRREPEFETKEKAKQTEYDAKEKTDDKS